MDEYLWNNRVDYLRKSRNTMWNNDYIQFLVEKVWHINDPVNIVDFGCGMGFLGVMLLPILPRGSTYTGIDKGKTLLEEAGKIFTSSPYNATFIEADLIDYQPIRKYDMAICQTVLQHIPESIKILEKMRDSVLAGGRVICIEVDRNLANAAMYFDGVDYNRLNNLGILQKLWLNDLKYSGSDHNIGMKIPVYMQKIGLKDIGVRLNDCVNFINSKGNDETYKKEYDSFIAGGWGVLNKDKGEFVNSLVDRGLTKEEAEYQFNCETVYNTYVSENIDSANIVNALCQIVSFGIV